MALVLKYISGKRIDIKGKRILLLGAVAQLVAAFALAKDAANILIANRHLIGQSCWQKR
jgi:glutamyl-tRNA reductase